MSLIDNFEKYGRTNFTYSLLFLINLISLDLIQVNSLIYDKDFAKNVQSFYSSLARKKGWAGVDEQYDKAEQLAEERWGQDDERCHWEMARDLMKEICDPIKEQIRKDFDGDFRLEYKKKQLKTNYTVKLDEEIKKLEEDLKCKLNNGTISLRTLKEKLKLIAEKPEYDKYCPEGGRKKKK